MLLGCDSTFGSTGEVEAKIDVWEEKLSSEKTGGDVEGQVEECGGEETGWSTRSEFFIKLETDGTDVLSLELLSWFEGEEIASFFKQLLS